MLGKVISVLAIVSMAVGIGFVTLTSQQAQAAGKVIRQSGAPTDDQLIDSPVGTTFVWHPEYPETSDLKETIVQKSVSGPDLIIETRFVGTTGGIYDDAPREYDYADWYKAYPDPSTWPKNADIPISPITKGYQPGDPQSIGADPQSTGQPSATSIPNGAIPKPKPPQKTNITTTNPSVEPQGNSTAVKQASPPIKPTVTPITTPAKPSVNSPQPQLQQNTSQSSTEKGAVTPSLQLQQQVQQQNSRATQSYPNNQVTATAKPLSPASWQAPSKTTDHSSWPVWIYGIFGVVLAAAVAGLIRTVKRNGWF